MKVLFLQDYEWYPNGYKIEKFGISEKHDLEKSLAERLINQGVVELDKPQKEMAKVKVDKVEKPKKQKLKPSNKKVKKETVEEK